MLGSTVGNLSCLAGNGRAFICTLIVDSDLQLPQEPTSTTNKEERDQRQIYCRSEQLLRNGAELASEYKLHEVISPY